MVRRSDPPRSSYAHQFLLHGIRLSLDSDVPPIGAMLATRLRHFAVPHAGAAHPVSDLEFTFRTGDDPFAEPTSQREARPVYEMPSGRVVYEGARDRLLIEHGDGVRVVCEPAAGRAVVTLRAPTPELFWPTTHLLFLLPLIEMLKRRGVFSVHAAALSVDGAGLLLAGGSGAGKSTLALALLRAGFAFLGDDMCFLAPAPDGVRTLSFPDEIDVAEHTARLIPELRFLLDRELPPGARKRPLLVEEVYDVRPATECRPTVLVFPRVAHTDRSVLAPMDAAEALLELVPNVLLTEPRAAQAHLDALGLLVGQCRCYRLQTGRDLDSLCSRLAALLQQPTRALHG
jgi:hypothetical protein